MSLNVPDLPPFWSSPAPIGHNGGPPMEHRAPSCPSIATPELRDRILDLLNDGVPLAVICRSGVSASEGPLIPVSLYGRLVCLSHGPRQAKVLALC